MIAAQPRFHAAHPFRLEPQQELHSLGVNPIAERPETFWIFCGVDLPGAGVEPGLDALPRVHLARIPCGPSCAGVTPADVRLNPRRQEALHVGDLRLGPADLNLGHRRLGLAVYPGQVVRDVPAPPEVLRRDNVLPLPEQQDIQRGADLLAGLQVEMRQLLPSQHPQSIRSVAGKRGVPLPGPTHGHQDSTRIELQVEVRPSVRAGS